VAIIFESHADLVSETSDQHTNFARFSLRMHAGTPKTGGSFEKSKSEAIYLPASPKTELSHGALPDPFQISTMHRIHFIYEFYNLGSIITADLSDDRDIAVRVMKATQQVGALTCFFHIEAVGVFTERLIFLAIPVTPS
jgi:hypothetical protein